MRVTNLQLSKLAILSRIQMILRVRMRITVNAKRRKKQMGNNEKIHCCHYKDYLFFVTTIQD